MRATLLVLSCLLGVAFGVGGFTFVYAEGHSYLSNDPSACANCHVMHEQYDGWLHGSHRAVAGCNDCHTPASFPSKYVVKAENGFWHSLKFTTGDFHEPIQIREKNHHVVEGACRSCHEAIVQAIDPPHGGGRDLVCTKCHGDVGHLR